MIGLIMSITANSDYRTIKEFNMWEYTTVTFNSLFDTVKSLKRKSDAVLERYGKDGWELVNFQCAGGLGSMMIFVFKREKK